MIPNHTAGKVASPARIRRSRGGGAVGISRVIDEAIASRLAIGLVATAMAAVVCWLALAADRRNAMAA